MLLAIALVLSMVEVTWASPKQAQHMKKCIQLRNEIYKVQKERWNIKQEVYKLIKERDRVKTIVERLDRLISEAKKRADKTLLKILLEKKDTCTTQVQMLIGLIEKKLDEEDMAQSLLEELLAKFDSNCKR